MTTLTCIVMLSRIVHAVADTCIQFVAACSIHGCLTFHAITFIFMQLHAVTCIDISIPCASMKMKLRVMNVHESHLLMSFCFVLLMCGDLLVLFSACLVLNVSFHYDCSCVADHICRGAGGADGARADPISRGSCCLRE